MTNQGNARESASLGFDGVKESFVCHISDPAVSMSISCRKEE